VEKKMTRSFPPFMAAIVAALAFFVITPAASAQGDDAPSITPAAAKTIIRVRARQVILAIQAKNMTSLSTFVHPRKGLRFSPYTYVNTGTDRVFTTTQVRGLATNQRQYLWGEEDGSGDPIRTTFNRYYRGYIYDRNFAAVRDVTYNEPSGGGTMISNLFTSYPGAIVVDYYVPGRNHEMDWKSLRLIFQKHGRIWYLVGVAHNEWTI
jgi:hypothetical protein